MYVESKFIDPARHKFIGLFRPAACPHPNGPCDVFFCGAGHALRYVGEEEEHWRRGCWDVPQYVDINGRNYD